MKYVLILFLTFIQLSLFAQKDIAWNMGMNVATNSYGNLHPRMSLDRAGNPLIVWGKMSDESVYFTRWNGTAFTPPVKLNSPGFTLATASWMGPDIASKGDTVYIVVKRTPEAADTNRIFIFTSFNGGVTFAPPVELAFIGDSISRFPTVDVDADGNPIVAFMKFNSSFMDSRWVVTKSVDQGKTFSIDVKASGWGNSAEVCDCCPGAIISNGNRCAMLYRNNKNNIRDSWVGISDNNASSFTSGSALENKNWMLMSCPSSGPDGVIIGDTLYATFMNGSGGYRTYLSKSSIVSGVLGNVTNLTGPISGLSQQNYPRIATDGKAAAIVWKQTVSGVAQLPILFTNNIEAGFPSSYDTVDLVDITNVDVAMSKGKVYVVWEDDNSGTVKFRSGSYSQTSTGVNNINEGTFTIYPNPVHSTITLESNIDLKNAKTDIYNSLGEKVMCLDKIGGEINLEALPRGVYILQLKIDTAQFIRKIIKE